MDPIREAHLSEGALLVTDIADADDATTVASKAAVARTRGTATAERTTRDHAGPGYS
ncbi:DUF6207 family protein [Streptomyces sp. NPDC088921]|uniref:DUF6207 family protein n=1 Tax=unclassified Streptomyces TaxID=2593676 RepID=UPI00342AF8A0